MGHGISFSFLHRDLIISELFPLHFPLYLSSFASAPVSIYSCSHLLSNIPCGPAFLSLRYLYLQPTFLVSDGAFLLELLCLSLSLSVSGHTLEHMAEARLKRGVIYRGTRKESYGQVTSYEDARRHSRLYSVAFNEKCQYIILVLNYVRASCELLHSCFRNWTSYINLTFLNLIVICVSVVRANLCQYSHLPRIQSSSLCR